MSSSIIIVAIVAVVFFGLVFAALNIFGTRMTGKQIAEDPDVRRHVDPQIQDDDFPVNADY